METEGKGWRSRGTGTVIEFEGWNGMETEGRGNGGSATHGRLVEHFDVALVAHAALDQLAAQRPERGTRPLAEHHHVDVARRQVEAGPEAAEDLHLTRTRARSRRGHDTVTTRSRRGHDAATTWPRRSLDVVTMRSRRGHDAITMRSRRGHDAATTRFRRSHDAVTTRPRRGHSTAEPVGQIAHVSKQADLQFVTTMRRTALRKVLNRSQDLLQLVRTVTERVEYYYWS